MKLSVASSLLVAAMTFLSIAATSQTSVKDLQKYMTEVREKPYQSLPASVLDDVKNEGVMLDVLVPYFSDTVRTVRQKAFYIAKRIGHKSKSREIQVRTITSLALALREKDTGIRGSALDALTQFNKGLFTVAVKDSIGKTISPQSPNLEVLVKLAGFLELKNYSQRIESVIASSNSGTIKWAARLALARMGDAVATEWIVNKLNTAKVNDDFVYDVVPDLVYTRQSAIFDYLERIINSDEANCHSPDPDSGKKILCGYRVLEQVAPAIKNFPFATDESGDLKVSDYEAALRQARSWFASNNIYTFNSDRF